jgi:hypothetical protein
VYIAAKPPTANIPFAKPFKMNKATYAMNVCNTLGTLPQAQEENVSIAVPAKKCTTVARKPKPMLTILFTQIIPKKYLT